MSLDTLPRKLQCSTVLSEPCNLRPGAPDSHPFHTYSVLSKYLFYTERFTLDNHKQNHHKRNPVWVQQPLRTCWDTNSSHSGALYHDRINWTRGSATNQQPDRSFPMMSEQRGTLIHLVCQSTRMVPNLQVTLKRHQPRRPPNVQSFQYLRVNIILCGALIM